MGGLCVDLYLSLRRPGIRDLAWCCLEIGGGSGEWVQVHFKFRDYEKLYTQLFRGKPVTKSKIKKLQDSIHVSTIIRRPENQEYQPDNLITIFDFELPSDVVSVIKNSVVSKIIKQDFEEFTLVNKKN